MLVSEARAILLAQTANERATHFLWKVSTQSTIGHMLNDLRSYLMRTGRDDDMPPIKAAYDQIVALVERQHPNWATVNLYGGIYAVEERDKS
jgi:hypothetical protein